MDITPDAKSNWLNQSDSDFDGLLSIANKQTKLRKASEAEQAIFELFSMGISTNRDDWVYDFDQAALTDKVEFFCGTYQAEMQRFRLERPDPQSTRDWVTKSIKWTSELETHLVRGSQLAFASQNIVPGVYRPFVVQHCYYAPIITHRRYQMPQIFPHGEGKQNKLICFCVNGKDFYALAVDKVANLHLTGDSQCLPMYRYTEDGERVSNITQWGIDRINGHYRREWGDDFESLAGEEGITAEEIFAYTYAVLHDPVYRHEYSVDLVREFPRLPLYHDFHHWAEMGRQLLDLHIGFESAEPYPLERIEKLPAASGSPSTGSGRADKTILRADKERGTITLDDATTLSGVPAAAWEYRLGSRSALEWVLDQYKERKPRDPTIAARFNTYKFSDHKAKVIDLLQRVCTVSVNTMEIVDSMAYWEGDELRVFGDRERDDFTTAALVQWANEPEDEEWLEELRQIWLETSSGSDCP